VVMITLPDKNSHRVRRVGVSSRFGAQVGYSRTTSLTVSSWESVVATIDNTKELQLRILSKSDQFMIRNAEFCYCHDKDYELVRIVIKP